VNFVYTPEGAAELTLALMDALGVERAALLGHSAGAPVALDAALVSPERCPALVLVWTGEGGVVRLKLKL
jgi:pimeloyl-ACP methyl ester carboxylesterase